MEWFASKWRFLAALFIAGVVAYLSYVEWQKQSVARAAGVEACTRLGHPKERCQEMVALNDAACLGLTGSDESRTRTGELVDPNRYVECVLEGPGPYRRKMRQRHSEARQKTETATPARAR